MTEQNAMGPNALGRRRLLSYALSGTALGIAASASGASPFFGNASPAAAGVTNQSLTDEGVPRYRYAWPYGYDVTHNSGQHKFGIIYTSNRHTGDDFYENLNFDKIPAVTAGEVVAKLYSGSSADTNPILGYRVVICGYDGIYTTYCHMKESSHLAVGDTVKIGDSVGIPGGSNGTADPYGIHLHLTMATAQGASQNGVFGIATNQDGTGAAESQFLINPARYIRANLASPIYDGTEPDPMPAYKRFTQSQDVSVQSSWTNLYTDSNPATVSFIRGPKMVNVTATVMVEGLTAGQTARVRVARTNLEGEIIDASAAATGHGQTSGAIYINVSANTSLADSRLLRLQATSTASGVRVTSVDLTTFSWDFQ